MTSRVGGLHTADLIERHGLCVGRDNEYSTYVHKHTVADRSDIFFRFFFSFYPTAQYTSWLRILLYFLFREELKPYCISR